MTDKPTPKEIDLLVRTYLGDCGPQANRVYSFVTAVLAKWGQPAQAAEPADTVVLTAAQESLGVEFEKVLHDNLFDLYEESPHTARLESAQADSVQEDAARFRFLRDGVGRTALDALKHPAVKPDMLVNGSALKLALNVLRRAGKNEVADELECTAQAGEYPELPPLQVRYDGLGHTTTMGYGASQMRDYADATCAARKAALAAPAQPLHVAAINCPHEIDKDRVVLHFDSKQPGKNALAQLAARLQAAQAQEARQPLTDAEVSSVYFEVLGTVRIQEPTLINRLVRGIK